jgi:hypothetical protein
MMISMVEGSPELVGAGPAGPSVLFMAGRYAGRMK